MYSTKESDQNVFSTDYESAADRAEAQVRGITVNQLHAEREQIWRNIEKKLAEAEALNNLYVEIWLKGGCQASATPKHLTPEQAAKYTREYYNEEV